MMKKIGLVGGISWTSTLQYYEFINDGVNKKMGGLNAAECILYSLNFNDVQELGWDKSFSLIYNACRRLEEMKVDYIALCVNTAHLFADYLQEGLNVPLIHIAEATGSMAKRSGLNKIGLLGTSFTMEMDFYHDKLKAYGVTTIIPNGQKIRSMIQRIIKDELGVGNIRSHSKQLLIEAANQLIEEGAEGIILACTELPMIISQEDIQVPMFDTTKIHVEVIVNAVVD